jgi:hypothetical protein
MSYFLFLDKTLFPVPPAKLQIKVNNKNRILNLINESEVNILKSPGLTEVSFEVLLPNSPYPFAYYYFGPFFKADFFLERLEHLKTRCKPFQFIFCRMSPKSFDILFDTNITVALEDYEIVEDANNGRDVMVNIQLKQYRPYSTKVLNVQTASDGTGIKTASIEKQRQTNREIPKICKAMVKQTLWEICKKHLGNGAKWQEIAKLNMIVDPNALVVGQVIKLVK